MLVYLIVDFRSAMTSSKYSIGAIKILGRLLCVAHSTLVSHKLSNIYLQKLNRRASIILSSIIAKLTHTCRLRHGAYYMTCGKGQNCYRWWKIRPIFCSVLVHMCRCVSCIKPYHLREHSVSNGGHERSLFRYSGNESLMMCHIIPYYTKAPELRCYCCCGNTCFTHKPCVIRRIL